MATEPVKVFRTGYELNWGTDTAGNPYRSATSPQSSISLQRGVTVKGGPFARWKTRLQSGTATTSALSYVGFNLKWPSNAMFSGIVGTDPATKKSSDFVQHTYYLNLPVSSWGPTVSGVQANNDALTRFVNKARQAQSSFMGGVFVGEIREAVRMFRPASSGLLQGMLTYLRSTKKVARRFKTGKKGSKRSVAAERTRALSDMWLEYSFGWSPFINDIESASKELTRIANEGVETKRVQGGGRAVSKNRVVDYTSHTAGGITQYFDLMAEAEYDFRYKGSVKVKSALSSPIAGVAEKLGFTFSQFVPTIWELIPWSFCVDYFTNVGDVLSAVSFPRSDLVYVVKGTKWTNRNTLYPTRIVLTGPQNFFAWQGRTSSPGVTVLEQFGLDRREYLEPLIPTLEFGIPGMPRQAFNLAALFAAHKTARRNFN